MLTVGLPHACAPVLILTVGPTDFPTPFSKIKKIETLLICQKDEKLLGTYLDSPRHPQLLKIGLLTSGTSQSSHFGSLEFSLPELMKAESPENPFGV